MSYVFVAVATVKMVLGMALSYDAVFNFLDLDQLTRSPICICLVLVIIPHEFVLVLGIAARNSVFIAVWIICCLAETVMLGYFLIGTIPIQSKIHLRFFMALMFCLVLNVFNYIYFCVHLVFTYWPPDLSIGNGRQGVEVDVFQISSNGSSRMTNNSAQTPIQRGKKFYRYIKLKRNSKIIIY